MTDRDNMLKMKATLEREQADTQAQRQRLAQALAETDAMLQRGAGALIVLGKLLDEPPAAADVPADEPVEVDEEEGEACAEAADVPARKRRRTWITNPAPGDEAA